MEYLHQPKSGGLRELYWRDEILQLVFWLDGEGFRAELDAGVLERFLGVGAQQARGHLDRLAAEGLLSRHADGRYRLTEAGERHRARIATNETDGLTEPGGGECGPTCWCRVSAEESEACRAGRLAGRLAAKQDAANN